MLEAALAFAGAATKIRKAGQRSNQNKNAVRASQMLFPMMLRRMVLLPISGRGVMTIAAAK